MRNTLLNRMEIANQMAEELHILADDLQLASTGDAGAIKRVEGYLDTYWHKLVIGPAWKIALICSPDD